MKKSQVDEILSKIKKQASAVAKVRSVLPQRKNDENNNGIPDDEEEYVPVGVGGLLAASQKLLAVNRGLDRTDERDSLLFKRILTTDKLLAERVRLDSDRVRGAMMPLIARHKNLKAVGPFAFDSYMEKFLIGNPLSSPLEEINPLHLLEQARRATQMGPGGIGTDNAITEEMQAIRTDQFGFLSTLEGPESMPGYHFVYTKEGWRQWTQVDESTLFACNITGNLEFHKATKINVHPFDGDLICAKHNNILMELTPHHRVYYSDTDGVSLGSCKVKYANSVLGECIFVPGEIDSIKIDSNHWYKRPYNDLVYCATVPGSKLFVRGSMETQPYWTGNSEKIGIDTRAAWGSKIGSDGRPYQKFFNRRTGKYQWMSPEDLDGLTVKLPD